ncbi:hypothetical protein TNCV_4755351 [Trichonephila clavipes]|nr:hypothetical protein TNCV_4755351 [Trichonephila clavipes]
MLAVAAEQQGGFFRIPGGTGKTFLLSLILAKIRSQQKIALAVKIVRHCGYFTGWWANSTFNIQAAIGRS